MGAIIKFYDLPEAEIISLNASNPKWVNRAFYYPSDNSGVFYQIYNGVLKTWGGSGSVQPGTGGDGITINGKIIGGVKSKIEPDDILNIPLHWEYNVNKLTVLGAVTCYGEINFI